MRHRSTICLLAGLVVLTHCAREENGGKSDVMPDASPRLAHLLRGDDPQGYSRALAPRSFSFPADHGPHESYRYEWWYLTGNLGSEGGDRFGFQLTFFRLSLAPGSAGVRAGAEWATNQVYMGHFSITDVAAERFHVSERFARGALGLAGAQALPLRIWLEDWSLAKPAANGANSWQVRAADRGIALTLSLKSLKAPVLNGQSGLAQKSAEPGIASYYYSIPRLQAKGKLDLAGEAHAVSGLVWLDREWGSNGLAENQEGWDWFALQLSDGSDLMFYNLRRVDSRQDPHSAGTWIPKSGDPVQLAHDDVRLRVQEYWENPEGICYPVRWTIGIPRLSLELEVEPVSDAQELQTLVRYWEGSVDVRGTRDGEPLGGRGYVELTGYASARHSGTQRVSGSSDRCEEPS